MKRIMIVLALSGALALGHGSVASAIAAADAPRCSTESTLECDADRDGIFDLVEEAVCGTATCATGTEDADGNGVADAEEYSTTLPAGGPAGPIRFVEPGWVQLVVPGPALVSIPWWPFALALAAAVAAFLVARARPRRRPGRHALTAGGERSGPRSG